MIDKIFLWVKGFSDIKKFVGYEYKSVREALRHAEETYYLTNEIEVMITQGEKLLMSPKGFKKHINNIPLEKRGLHKEFIV